MMKIFSMLALWAWSISASRVEAQASDAISWNDARLVSWANGFQDPVYGTGVDQVWRTPAKALGRATTDLYDIVCLGNGGRITIFFPHPIRNGPGADFAVFENSFGLAYPEMAFLELAFVEVSSDGVNFFRFPCVSLNPNPVGGYGFLNPTKISGLAGKHVSGQGTPFDLTAIPDSPLLDKENVRFVRIIDIIGDGGTKDSLGNPIHDPTPTTGSGGFDLEAIGVIHQNDGQFRMGQAEIVAGEFRLQWASNPGSRYRVETSITLASPGWQPVQEMAGDKFSGTTRLAWQMTGEPRRFWRIVRLP